MCDSKMIQEIKDYIVKNSEVAGLLSANCSTMIFDHLSQVGYDLENAISGDYVDSDDLRNLYNSTVKGA